MADFIDALSLTTVTASTVFLLFATRKVLVKGGLRFPQNHLRFNFLLPLIVFFITRLFVLLKHSYDLEHGKKGTVLSFSTVVSSLILECTQFIAIAFLLIECIVVHLEHFYGTVKCTQDLRVPTIVGYVTTIPMSVFLFILDVRVSTFEGYIGSLSFFNCIRVVCLLGALCIILKTLCLPIVPIDPLLRNRGRTVLALLIVMCTLELTDFMPYEMFAASHFFIMNHFIVVYCLLFCEFLGVIVYVIICIAALKEKHIGRSSSQLLTVQP